MLFVPQDGELMARLNSANGRKAGFGPSTCLEGNQKIVVEECHYCVCCCGI